ncbi:MAG TPA: cell division protein FtsQ/DivIB, partial [Chthonomonadales bacterium]|nr:cell division protein FtsQ/DivIB [Chthonomonadales bacterium]
DPGTNWLLAPVHRIETRLRRLPWIRAAAAGRTLTGGVWVRVINRRPAAVVHSGAQYMEVDQTGWSIRPARASMIAGLPRIVLLAAPRLRIGASIDSPAVRQSVSLMNSLRADPVVRIAKIEVDQTDGIWLNMQDGVRIGLGQCNDLQQKLHLVRNLYLADPKIADRVEVVNLTVPSSPAAQLRPAATGQKVVSTSQSGGGPK